ncbi:MAG: methyltransferase domain-containing protein [Candidatus Pacebacteria bacterium]|nr:methyltransferase domain-containing protein [Candidatus Paceibacterota bacterium]
MELRKKEEIKHANKLKTLLKDALDREKIASNKKFYSITWSSKKFIKEWLLNELLNTNKKFLDYCCGEGETCLFLAKEGVDVTGIDISDVSIKLAEEKALKEVIKDNLNFLVMDGENMTFSDNTFDVIFCSGVLHHLDINKAFQELNRVLKPNGKIICNEPLAYNPIFQLYRKRTPQLRTEWEAEHILKKEDIYLAKKYFNKLEIRSFHLATLLAVPFRKTKIFNFILGFLEKIDFILLKIPFIKWLSWQVVFILEKPKKSK